MTNYAMTADPTPTTPSARNITFKGRPGWFIQNPYRDDSYGSISGPLLFDLEDYKFLRVGPESCYLSEDGRVLQRRQETEPPIVVGVINDIQFTGSWTTLPTQDPTALAAVKQALLASTEAAIRQLFDNASLDAAQVDRPFDPLQVN